MSGQSPRASVSIAVLAVLVALAFGIGSSGVAAQATGDYVILQGEECRPLDSLGDGSQPVTEFYDYRSPDTDPSGWYETYGEARELLRADTSQIFLYRGSEGLSLVFLHDGVGSNTTSGGAVEAHITGVPAGSEWVVEDDSYEGQDDDSFESGSEASASWAWNEGTRTDGGAYRLDGDWETLTVEMAFNEAARQYPYEKWNGEPEANEIDSWIARSDGETYDLAMDEPITIARGDCEAAMVGTETASEDSENTDGTNPEGSDSGASDDSTPADGSGGLPVDLPSLPELPEVPAVPGASGSPDVPELPAVDDLPDAPSDAEGEWVGEAFAGLGGVNPAGVLVLVLALVAIAFVTLRR